MVDIEVQPATSVRPIDHDRQFPRKGPGRPTCRRRRNSGVLLQMSKQIGHSFGLLRRRVHGLVTLL
jgi:hypothetical protein